MANKMAEKKKNANQSSPRSQMPAARTRGAAKEQPVKSGQEMVRDEQRTQREESRQSSKTAAKSSGVAARDGRKEQTARESKQPAQPARRDSKDVSLVMRFRNSKIGRFVFDAYYELLHKVTWPTFEEARNMTIAVIALSVAVGLILGALDFGLLKLFTLLSGGH